jgi:hypothetical protein
MAPSGPALRRYVIEFIGVEWGREVPDLDFKSVSLGSRVDEVLFFEPTPLYQCGSRTP